MGRPDVRVGKKTRKLTTVMAAIGSAPRFEMCPANGRAREIRNDLAILVSASISRPAEDRDRFSVLGRKALYRGGKHEIRQRD